MKRKTEEFPKFWFEGNLYFGMINKLEDFERMVSLYESTMTRDELLDKVVNEKGNLSNFGLKSEYNGIVTLREHLINVI